MPHLVVTSLVKNVFSFSNFRQNINPSIKRKKRSQKQERKTETKTTLIVTGQVRTQTLILIMYRQIGIYYKSRYFIHPFLAKGCIIVRYLYGCFTIDYPAYSSNAIDDIFTTLKIHDCQDITLCVLLWEIWYKKHKNFKGTQLLKYWIGLFDWRGFTYQSRIFHVFQGVTSYRYVYYSLCFWD